MASVGKRCPSLSVGRSIGAALMVTSVLLLASCNSATVNTGGTGPGDLDVMDKVRSLDILPRYPTQAGSSTTSSGARAQPVVFQGTEITDIAEPRPQPQASGNGFDLNFEGAPVATVAKVVLGDIMQTGYTIDPRVQGTVSLVSVRPVPKSDIIFVLENALRISGIALVRDTAGYRLTPVGDAVGAGHVDSAPNSPEPGYGVSVVPLQFVSAQTMLKLMDSFATKPGVVRADTTRNLLLIQGTGSERRTAVETATGFDVDWMRGQSIGLFPVTNSGPEPIIAELEKIVDSGENGLSQNMIKMQPVARLNAIMVVAKKPALLRTVETWIKRLDRSDSTRTSVHVYKVKYGEAKQIARVLTDMFGGGSSSSSLLDSADNQIAPGSGTSASGSGNSAFGNNANSSNSTNGGNSASQQPGSGFGTRLGTAFGGPQNSANGGNLGQLDKGNGSGSGGPPVLQNVRITPDVVNNTLLIYADQGNYKIIEAALQQVDKRQLQVAIDATIAEVDLTDELQFGVQFFLTSHALGLRPDQGSILNSTSTTATTTIPGASTATTTASAATTATTTASTVAGTAANALLSRTVPGFNFLVGQEAQPAAILTALHTVTGVKVLSNPSLVVMNNQSATLQVGNQVPISTGSASVLNAATASSNTIVNTVDYRNTGIILHVSPRVSANGDVRLEIEQEISNVLPGSAANALNPTIQERKVKSSISVANGQTVLLAGLIQDQKNENKSGIPLLDEIQGLGNAFSNQDNTKMRTELIIFIRPQIIGDGMEAHTIAEEFRSKLRGTVSASSPNATNAH
jgi:general secretion pathway protein D